MLSSRSSMGRAIFRAANSSRGVASTSAQAFALPRPRVMPFTSPATASSMSSHFFSSSSRTAKEDGEAKSTEQRREEENVAAGEAMGASEKRKTESEGGEASATDELQKTIKEKDAKIKDLTDAVLYGKADMQNLQRRSQEEKAQASDYAVTKFARDLTSSLDIFALALKSVPEQLRSKPADATEANDPRKVLAELYSGVELTSKSISDMLRMHGVTSFDPTGQKFDPQEHEAMYQAPIPDKEPGTVLECSKVGYKIKDRILRAAQVGVVQATS